MGYSISREGTAPDPKHVEKIKNARAPTNNKQLESFVGLANFYRRVIPDFAKLLPLNNMRNRDFLWGKMEQKAFEEIKIELCANPLVSHIVYKKKQQLLLTPLKKPLAGFFRKKDIQSYM